METYSLWFPLGLAALASAIRARHQVTLLDAPHQKMSLEAFIRYVEETRPDVVGFSAIILGLYGSFKAAEAIKRFDPSIVTVIGGPHVSGDPEGTMALSAAMDYGFMGEADVGLPVFLDRLEAGEDLDGVPGLIRRTEAGLHVESPRFVEDLDGLALPSWDLLDLASYPSNNFFYMGKNPNALLSVTRGCPRRCVFCGTKAIVGPGYRKRSIDKVIEEIRLLRSRYGVQTLMFVDDNLTADRRYALALFERLAALPERYEWVPIHGLRLDTLDEELVRAMDRSGCLLFYAGIESGSPRILAQMDKEITRAAIQEKVRMIRRVSDIKICAYFILGFPGETEDEARDTIRFARELGLDRALFHPNMLSPGSPQFHQLRAGPGLRELTVDDYQDPIPASYNQIYEDLAGGEGLSMEQLRPLFRKAYLSFYMNPRVAAKLARDMTPEGLRHGLRWLVRYFWQE